MISTVVQQLESAATRMIRWFQTDSFGRRLVAGEVSADEYARFLIQTYHYIRWTTPLQSKAAERLRHDRPLLAQIFQLKAKEADGHDAWLLRDLRALGWSPREVMDTTASKGVEAYVAWNRLVAEAGPAVGLLGTGYVLERVGEKLAAEAARNLLVRSRIPEIRRAVSFLHGHAKTDPGYVEEVVGAITEFVLPEEERMVVLCGRLTALSYLDLATPGTGRRGQLHAAC